MGDQPGASVPLHDGSVDEVLGRVTDAVFALDEEWRFTYLNERAEDVVERDREDLLGAVIWEAFPEAANSVFRDAYERAMATQEPVAFEEYYGPLDCWLEVRAYPSATGLSVYLRDVTDRVRQQTRVENHERALRRAYEVVAGEGTFEEKIDELLEVVRETVGTTYATLSRVQDDEYVFEAVAAPGDADIQVGDRISLEMTNCERIVSTGQSLVLNDIQREAPELAARAGNEAWGIACYLGTPVYLDGELYGTFCFYDTEPRVESFTDWEVTFVDLLGDWVSHELDRERHLDQLATLDELNGVVHEITDAIVDQSTREELETVACQRLAEADGYRFAWVGDIDQRQGQVTPRTAVGDGIREYLDTVDLGYGTEADGTPLGRAIETGAVQVGRRREGAAADHPWRAQAEASGFECWAAVPITDEGTLYGVLNVYSDRSDAFAGQELSVLEQLGELLGHAITATQRKAALMSEDVLEVEFEVRNAFGTASTAGQGTVHFDRTVPVREGSYVVYGGADEAGMTSLRAITDELPSWRSLTVLSDHDTETRFELQLSEPPVVSAVAAHGGRVESAGIEDGTYRVTVHLPRGADVRTLVDGVKRSYPDTEVIAQRRTAQHEDAGTGLPPTLLDDLTDRQRATIESAFYGGFFEWPRDSTGEDIASSMGVSPATFHQHLRTGERKILAALLTTDD